MTRPPRLLALRADADSRRGAGHVMRCLALAQAWHDHGGAAAFVGHISAAPLRERIESEGFPVIALTAPHPNPYDLSTFLPWLHQRQEQAGWVALDGYHFDPAYHQAIRAAGWPLLVIDDYAHLPTYHADILVNPNAYAGEIHYPAKEPLLNLRGPRFALLRKEFRQALQPTMVEGGVMQPGPARHVLVTMGGADPDNVTGKVIDALRSLGKCGLTVKVIAGPLNLHRQQLADRLSAPLDAEILLPVTDMAPLMRWADLAISAAGSTCWELAAMGVPMIVTALADNQTRVAASLAGHGAAVNLGWHQAWQAKHAAQAVLELLGDPQKLQTMGRHGKKLIDGRGCGRVVQAMQGCHFSLRPASEDDCETIFQWANDPANRAASFSQQPIAWQDHCRWFAARISDPDHIFYLAITPEETAMAQARFALPGNEEAIMSVSLAPDFRGVGLGARLIRQACNQAMKDRPVKKILAYIRRNNTSSLHAFTQAGFWRRGDVEVSGQPALAMEYSPERLAA